MPDWDKLRADAASIGRSATAAPGSSSKHHGRRHKSQSTRRSSGSSQGQGGASLKSPGQGGASLFASQGSDASLRRRMSLEALGEEEEDAYVPPKRDKDYGSMSYPSRYDDGKGITKNHSVHRDSEVPAHQDFLQHPGQAYWTWDVDTQRWKHVDSVTGQVTWAPQRQDFS